METNSTDMAAKTRWILMSLAFFSLSQGTVLGQKFGFVQTSEILQKMPEFQEMEQQLALLEANWRSELQQMQQELDSLERSFKAEEILLTFELQQERREEIALKAEALRTYQVNAFGPEGLLFEKRKELLQPLQEEIFQAVKKVAEAKQLGIVFDSSEDRVMQYVDQVHNYTDYVLEQLELGDPADVVR